MVADNIRALCKEHGTSLFALEKSVGLGNGTIGKWNDASPRADGLKRVADYFGVTVDALLKEGDECGAQ